MADDERLIRRLRVIESQAAPDPAFVEELHARLAADLGLLPRATPNEHPSRLLRAVLEAERPKGGPTCISESERQRPWRPS